MSTGSSALESLILQLCTSINTATRTCTRCSFTVTHPQDCINEFKSQWRHVCPSYSRSAGRTLSRCHLRPRGDSCCMMPSRAAGCTVYSAPGIPSQATGEWRLQWPSHIGSTFMFCSHGSRNRETGGERLVKQSQRTLSSCRTMPTICRNLSFFRCFRAISARAVSSGSWV